MHRATSGLDSAYAFWASDICTALVRYRKNAYPLACGMDRLNRTTSRTILLVLNLIQQLSRINRAALTNSFVEGDALPPIR